MRTFRTRRRRRRAGRAAIIQAAARELNLAPEVLATRRDLELLADGSRDVGLLRGWRRGAVGERLLAAL
ncbi:MAG: hypothetical protein E6K45_02205 [Gammaproteobacteria bacterium]|nr:MAG: hypothetical protein E6K45_02205 [Gammaproteobacteria bacterium]